nr:YchJ family metal-binding protein [Tessaracoccus sp. MC1627]
MAGERQAATAEELMRSRYSAFVVGDGDYLWRTWHPSTRPESVRAHGVEWTGLTVLDVVDGGPGDEVGVVEFEAAHRDGALRERSRFARRAGRWMYVDGAFPDP